MFCYTYFLGTIYMLDAPFLMSAVVSIVIRFINTETLKLIQTSRKDMFAKIGKEQVPTTIGGDYEYVEKSEKDDNQTKE